MVFELFGSMRDSAIAIDTDMYGMAMRAMFQMESKKMSPPLQASSEQQIGQAEVGHSGRARLLAPGYHPVLGSGMRSSMGSMGMGPGVPKVEDLAVLGLSDNFRNLGLWGTGT